MTLYKVVVIIYYDYGFHVRPILIETFLFPWVYPDGLGRPEVKSTSPWEQGGFLLTCLGQSDMLLVVDELKGTISTPRIPGMG